MEFKEVKPVFSKEKKLEFIKNLIERKRTGIEKTWILASLYNNVIPIKEPEPDLLLQLVKDILFTEKNNAIKDMEIQFYKDA